MGSMRMRDRERLLVADSMLSWTCSDQELNNLSSSAGPWRFTLSLSDGRWEASLDGNVVRSGVAEGEDDQARMLSATRSIATIFMPVFRDAAYSLEIATACDCMSHEAQIGLAVRKRVTTALRGLLAQGVSLSDAITTIENAPKSAYVFASMDELVQAEDVKELADLVKAVDGDVKELAGLVRAADGDE